MTKQMNIAVIGAGTLVGETLLELLEQRDFPVNELVLLEELEKAGGRIEFRHKQVKVQDIAGFDFSSVQLAFFVSSTKLSEQYVSLAAKSGCVVIDRSPAFRHDVDIPMVVATVNPEDISAVNQRNIISIPGCLATQLIMVIKPLADVFGVERLVISTYQAVSGAGRAGLEELGRQTAAMLNFQDMKTSVFPQQIAFNLIPQIGGLNDAGHCDEENKLIDETRRLLLRESLPVHATTVRVPVFYAHSMSVNMQATTEVDLTRVREILTAQSGLCLRNESLPVTPVTDAVGEEQVVVSRLRQQVGDPQNLDLWVMTDNLRQGSALNSVQIAEILVKHHL